MGCLVVFGGWVVDMSSGDKGGRHMDGVWGGGCVGVD